MTQDYRAFGHVYNVMERQKENFGESLTDDHSWFEYEVFLEDSSGEIVDMWDSLTETYNGVKGQRLSEKEAMEAKNEIVEDINEKNKDPTFWFNIS